MATPATAASPHVEQQNDILGAPSANSEDDGKFTCIVQPHFSIDAVKPLTPRQICYSVPPHTEAIFSTCCHQLFCYGCISQWRQITRSVCPHCRNAYPYLPGDLPLAASERHIDRSIEEHLADAHSGEPALPPAERQILRRHRARQEREDRERANMPFGLGMGQFPPAAGEHGDAGDFLAFVNIIGMLGRGSSAPRYPPMRPREVTGHPRPDYTMRSGLGPPLDPFMGLTPSFMPEPAPQAGFGSLFESLMLAGLHAQANRSQEDEE